MFYTNVFMRGDRIYMRGYDMGMRTTDIINYTPYMFIPKPNGKFRTLDGRPVDKLYFDSIKEAKDFVQRYEDVANMDIYGLNLFQYLYIYDYFKGDIDYDPKIVNVGTLDLECKADEGFPSIEKADKEITAITIRSKGRNYVFACGNFHNTNPNTYYIKCLNEYDLLTKFIETWQFLDLDIVTGWNIEFFDIPYLINRIKLLLGDTEAKKLSPWKMIDAREAEFRGKTQQTYTIHGITTLDYLQLYRKFSFGNQESYKLDYIAQVELGEKKIDYSEYGSLLELYKNNFQKFIEYNIHDCILVERLDDKLKFIEQVMALAYDAKVNYLDTMTTVRPWDIIIHNYLLDQGIVIPQFKKQDSFDYLVGGYVKEPQIGLSKWVVSFDLNSLYPHLIMQYNISPETFMGRASSFASIETLIKGEGNILQDYDIPGDFAVAANGCYYRKDKQGFLPALMEKMYNDRVVYKQKMLDAKKSFEKTKSPDDEKLVARYHNMQLAKKIQLNSAYGALGNEWFRWFNFNHAQAITTSGQLSIRWIERKINQFMNKALKTEDIDYVIASDTDSIYVTMAGLVDKLPNGTDELDIVRIIDEFCEKKIQKFIDSCYQELAEYMNAYQQKMKMKRETIANKAIWRGAKMYILNAWNVEGVQYDKPKLKISGIETTRSSTPHICREKIKDALSIIMNKDEKTLQKFVASFKEEFNGLSFEDVAFPRGINGMNKYYDKDSIYKKGTPIHVKGSLLFNNLIKKHGLKNVPPIQDADKIRFAYLKMPNPIHDTVISCPDELPEIFNLDKYIDRDMQFEKSFLSPVKSITNIIGWNAEERSTLDSFFA